MANGNSYLGLAGRAEELNIRENSQAELDASARAGVATSDSEHMPIVLCRVTDTAIACRFVFKFIWLCSSVLFTMMDVPPDALVYLFMYSVLPYV